jgi:protein gp37
MAENTAIEWTDVTDNIIVVKGGGWWCRKLSPGCANCYAAKLNQNGFYGGNHLAYGGEAPELFLREDILDRWQRQTKARRHFVASMTDVFGEWVPQEWIFRFLDAMRAAPRQTFQVLSKRSAVMRRQVCAWLRARGLDVVPVNIWLGASVEDQIRADERIPQLIAIPAAVRFLSVEPLLGPVDLSFHLGLAANHDDLRGAISWVIVGGESGSKARPMNPAWVLLLRDQCVEAGVAFFFKQWGEWLTVPVETDAEFSGGRAFDDPNGGRSSVASWVKVGAPSKHYHLWDDHSIAVHIRGGKKAAGRSLEGRAWNQFPTISL